MSAKLNNTGLGGLEASGKDASNLFKHLEGACGSSSVRNVISALGSDMESFLVDLKKIALRPGWGGFKGRTRTRTRAFDLARFIAGLHDSANLKRDEMNVADFKPVILAFFCDRIKNLGEGFPPSATTDDLKEAALEFYEDVENAYREVKRGQGFSEFEVAQRLARAEPVAFDGDADWTKRDKLAANLVFRLPKTQGERFYISTKDLGRFVAPSRSENSFNEIGIACFKSLVRHGLVEKVKDHVPCKESTIYEFIGHNLIRAPEHTGGTEYLSTSAPNAPSF